MEPPPYDDGSSTESEYYFDPAEETQEEAAHDVKQEPQPIKQEYTEYKPVQEDAAEIQLPQGSEWSHGASAECDNAVERALAMASRFEQEMKQPQRKMNQPQQEKALTADTMTKSSEEEHKATIPTSKKEEVKIKAEMVSLKSVKAATVAGNPLVMGLRRPPSVVTGEPSELEKGLSVPRSTSWKTSLKTSPSEVKEKKLAPKQTETRSVTERVKSPSVRRTELESRRAERSKSRGRQRSRSPSRLRRTDRSKSHFPRRCRSRSSRRVEERRSRSRSTNRPSAATTSRYRSYWDVEDSSSPRHHYTEKRSSYAYERSRSPHPSHSRRRSRSRGYSRDRDRYDHHHGTRQDHHEESKRKCASRVNRGLDSPLSQRESAHVDGHVHERSKSAAVRLNSDRDGNKPWLQQPESSQTRRPPSDKSYSSTAMLELNNPMKKAPTDPHIRPRKQAPRPNDNFKKPGCIHYDEFERSVFKLKLQEADFDEKTRAGFLDGSEKWVYENRLKGIAAERARLMAQNLERFEKLHAASTVSDFELKRYQGSRDFAWRVVQFKRKQASLQEQNDVFTTSERRDEWWRRLDEEREKLIAENTFMFHKVMMSPDRSEGTFRARQREAFTANANTPRNLKSEQFSKGNPRVSSTMRQPPSANSRVVVGAALAMNNNTRPSNTPWGFLKG